MQPNNWKDKLANNVEKVGIDWWARKIMRETGWTPAELAEVPIPVFVGMVKDIIEENKKRK